LLAQCIAPKTKNPTCAKHVANFDNYCDLVRNKVHSINSII
jgi:hypothetical protein